MMRRKFKAVVTPVFVLWWLLMLSFGFFVLLFPHLCMNAYGTKSDMLDAFIDRMCDLFDHFKES